MTRKFSPINFELRNHTKSDFIKLIMALEASILRCCKCCDEPLDIVDLVKTNEWFFDERQDILIEEFEVFEEW